MKQQVFYSIAALAAVPGAMQAADLSVVKETSAIAITNGGFNKSGINYMKDVKHYSVEGPGNCGMVWASWNKETQVAAMLKREKKGGAE